MEPTDLTIEILSQIRDETKGTRQAVETLRKGLENVREGLDTLTGAVDQINQP